MDEEKIAEQGGAAEPERTFTQDEVNALMGKVRSEVRHQFSDYETLKEKAAAFDESEEARKSELEKAQERAAKAEGELESLKAAAAHNALVQSVASAKGVDPSLLHGSTEDELEANADALIAWREQSTKSVYPSDKGGGKIPPQITKEEIMREPNKAKRNRLIAENLELFA